MYHLLIKKVAKWRSLVSGIAFTFRILWIFDNNKDIKGHNIKSVFLNMLKHSERHIWGVGDMFHCILYVKFLTFMIHSNHRNLGELTYKEIIKPGISQIWSRSITMKFSLFQFTHLGWLQLLLGIYANWSQVVQLSIALIHPWHLSLIWVGICLQQAICCFTATKPVNTRYTLQYRIDDDMKPAYKN
jgi:hypothetical protein